MSRSLLALAAGLALLLVVMIAGGDHGSPLWPLAGRMHPLMVHLPIGILLLAAVAEVVGRRSGRVELLQLVTPALLVGAWCAIAAGLAGILLSDWGSYDPGVLTWHRRLGVAIPFLATITYALRQRSHDGALRRVYPVVGGALVVTLVVGGHLGGTLSRGEGYLTRYLPEALRLAVGLPGERALTRLAVGNPDTTGVYSALIQPILTSRCGSCHNPQRKKGGLILTSADGLAAGGRQGKAIVAGRPDDSEMIIRLSLPPGHTDAMPPDRAIPVAELALLRWWIEQGASTEVRLGDIERPVAVRRTLVAYGLDDLPSGIFALQVAAVDQSAEGEARKAGLTIQRLGANTEYLSVDATNLAPDWVEARLELLRPLAASVAWADFSRSPVTDASLSILAAMPRLTRLQLSQTRVSDAGLQHLRALQYLEYLNLVDTDVSDDGLRALEGMSRLRAVYLWGSRVTAGGVERLQRALPRAQIRLGAPPLVKPAPLAERDSAVTRSR